MNLIFVQILFLFGTCNLSKGLGIREKRSGTARKDGLTLNENETVVGTEITLRTLLEEQPAAVVMELRDSLLQTVKENLEGESESNFSFRTTLLATYDSTGLQDASVYNDTLEICQAITDLQPSPLERELSAPTIRVLRELLQGDLPEGPVLLLTMSKPSDEDFAEDLIQTLMNRKCHLSVLWAGNNQTEDYISLKNVARRTGGKFRFLSVENSNQEYFPKSEFEKLSEQVRFPGEQQKNGGEETPMVLRASDQKVVQKTVIPLVVEVASGTSLEVRPGTPTQIQFTVKNNINIPLSVFFSAKYNGIIQNVQPHQAQVPPSATITVIVNLQPIGAAQSVNAIGTLTFTAVAGNTIITSRQALIFLTPQTTTDTYAPKMSHRYEGDCSNYKEPQNCDQGQWSLEATIKDEESGLLKVLSEPYGLLFQTQFVAGTKSPVTVFYTATCCQPNVIIWAEDLKGNFVKKSFDVFNQNLLAGEIASIVLGVLLILFIIIAIIVAVILIKKRNQRNFIIPRPRSESR